MEYLEPPVHPEVHARKDHYTYTLAYPDSMGGCVFYVGKGTSAGAIDRIDIHEIETRRGIGLNPDKQSAIRRIWANGEQVVKTKIASFETDEDACMFEIALITLMDNLTNVTGGGDGRVRHRALKREKKDEKVYKPSKFAQLIGVHLKTLQSWDNKDLFPSRRTPTNRRYYTHDDYVKYCSGQEKK